MTGIRRHSTFRDLVAMVADFRGTAEPTNDRLDVPTDAYELSRCQELVQRGWQRVVQSWPHWEWKKRHIVVRIKQGESVIRMPWFFNGCVYGHALYEHPGPNDRIEFASIRRFHEETTNNQSSGHPRLGCFERNPETGAAGLPAEPYWNMHLHPAADADYSVRLLVECEPRGLWHLDDAPFAGPDYDRLVRLAVQAEAEFDVNKAVGNYDAMFREELALAKARSAEANREIMGSLENGPHAHRGYLSGTLSPVTLNGVTYL